MKTTIGGDRLGAGNKQEISMKNYERSTHDLSYIWRSSMACGTLVPFLTEVALPGDNFDIELDCNVLTLPTVGPLFSSYKVQLDIFQCPIRLYNGKLHMNKLGIGMDMSKIKLPQIKLEAEAKPNGEETDDNSQINPSCILSYLNIRGIGRAFGITSRVVEREFNAVPFLGYWDIYKNYYANKQEERGVFIHDNLIKERDIKIKEAYVQKRTDDINVLNNPSEIDWSRSQSETGLRIKTEENSTKPDPNSVMIQIVGYQEAFASAVFDDVRISGSDALGWILEFREYNGTLNQFDGEQAEVTKNLYGENGAVSKPKLEEFDLENIDVMRENILTYTKEAGAYVLDVDSIEPYGKVNYRTNGRVEPEDIEWSKLSSQEGLAIKTYQSDLFNNWISTEWIDGENGINEVTSVKVTDDAFTIDALNLAHKVYNMLNRIALSGGTYDDWLDAVYTNNRTRSVESPIYQGSLIKELGFEEVVSTASSGVEGEEVLGTLAGRGKLGKKHKGGKIKIKVEEPSYIMGIVSITPRIDYSQGNKWDTNLKTMNDLHKPALDQIGFQDLITDQMAWFDTIFEGTEQDIIKFKSAGKQPAWINYMTNVNQCRGNFAIKSKDMFMTLNRRYDIEGGLAGGIGDLTTYIDPAKFNHIFAQTELDAQNFWVQIAIDMKARRKMSAKVIPNL